MASNQQYTGSAESFEARLNELLKKDKLNADEEEEYVSAWCGLVRSAGINEKTVNLFYNGFPLVHARPAHSCAARTGAEVYRKICSSPRSARNAHAEALKASLSLLALELISPTSDAGLDVIGQRIPFFCKAQSGKVHPALNRSVSEYLIRPMAGNRISKNAQISKPEATEMLRALKGALDECASNRKLSAEEKGTAREIAHWLERHADGESPFGEARVETSETFPASGGKQSAPIVEITASGTTAAKDSIMSAQPKGAEKAGKGAPTKAEAEDDPPVLDMAAVRKFLTRYQRQHEKLEEEHSSLSESWQAAVAKGNALEAELRKTRKNLEDCRQHRETLSRNYAKLQQVTTRLTEQNEELTARLESAEDTLELVDKRDAHKSIASLQRLSSELKYDYQDYLGIATLPMTVELGEMLRVQLQAVFDVLKTNGVDLEEG